MSTACGGSWFNGLLIAARDKLNDPVAIFSPHRWGFLPQDSPDEIGINSRVPPALFEGKFVKLLEDRGLLGPAGHCHPLHLCCLDSEIIAEDLDPLKREMPGGMGRGSKGERET